MILKLIKSESQKERIAEISKLKERIKILKQEEISEESSMQLQIYDNRLSDALKQYLSL